MQNLGDALADHRPRGRIKPRFRRGTDQRDSSINENRKRSGQRFLVEITTPANIQRSSPVVHLVLCVLMLVLRPMNWVELSPWFCAGRPNLQLGNTVRDWLNFAAV